METKLAKIKRIEKEMEDFHKENNKKITDIELLQRYRDLGGNYTEMLKTLTAKAD